MILKLVRYKNVVMCYISMFSIKWMLIYQPRIDNEIKWFINEFHAIGLDQLKYLLVIFMSMDE